MDKILFSERLKKRRKEKGYLTQRAFAKAYDEKFPPKRKDDSNGSDSGFLGTLKNYESGGDKCKPKLQYVVNICKLLDCSVDYLLGESDIPTHELKFVCDYTGLSEKSILRLKDYNETDGAYIIDLLDDLIIDRDNNGFNTLAQIASIAHALTALRETIPTGSLQANVNFAGLNWTCQNSFMQFIDRYTKT